MVFDSYLKPIMFNLDNFWYQKNHQHCGIYTRKVGLEPTTARFRVECSTIKLLPIVKLINGTISNLIINAIDPHLQNIIQRIHIIYWSSYEVIDYM